jgi:hypothetical protein
MLRNEHNVHKRESLLARVIRNRDFPIANKENAVRSAVLLLLCTPADRATWPVAYARSLRRFSRAATLPIQRFSPMKIFPFALAMTATAFALPAQADLAVSIGLGQPGFYGQIDLGNSGPPPVVYARPVIINQGPAGVVVAPLYLHVPADHAQHWRRYCGQYGACGRPVFFVRDDWYNRVYAPRYREEHRGDHRDERRDGHRDDDHRDDHRDNR